MFFSDLARELSFQKFFLQNVRNEIFKILKMFKYTFKLTRAACWINSKISNWDKNTTLMIFLFCHYCLLLLWWDYWRYFMLWNCTSWSCLMLGNCSNTASSLSMPCDLFLIISVSSSVEKWYFVMLNVKLDVKLRLKTFHWL